jgi:hypothetical protein
LVIVVSLLLPKFEVCYFILKIKIAMLLSGRGFYIPPFCARGGTNRKKKTAGPKLAQK